eukprot:5025840-Pyramimonas_sp.AAC.1
MPQVPSDADDRRRTTTTDRQTDGIRQAASAAYKFKGLAPTEVGPRTRIDPALQLPQADRGVFVPGASRTGPLPPPMYRLRA